MHVKFMELYNTAYAEIVNNTASFLVTKDMVIERYSELIVRECIGVADHSNVTGKSIIGERIKEHFGVKE